MNVKSKNMSREYGGQWLSSTICHVRIYAAYIDPVTCAFDQTQMGKLTLILDPTNEFVWTSETCNMVYGYFQELVDHYEVMLFYYYLFIFFVIVFLFCKNATYPEEIIRKKKELSSKSRTPHHRSDITIVR